MTVGSENSAEIIAKFQKYYDDVIKPDQEVLIQIEEEFAEKLKEYQRRGLPTIHVPYFGDLPTFDKAVGLAKIKFENYFMNKGISEEDQKRIFLYIRKKLYELYEKTDSWMEIIEYEIISESIERINLGAKNH